MDNKSIVSIILIPENPKKDIGITRIEEIDIKNENEDIEQDASVSFKYSFHNEDDNSFQNMKNEIANYYGVDPSIIELEYK